jgi:hypothetical protein
VLRFWSSTAKTVSAPITDSTTPDPLATLSRDGEQRGRRDCSIWELTKQVPLAGLLPGLIAVAEVFSAIGLTLPEPLHLRRG